MQDDTHLPTFVIIGCGHAGSQAASTLRSEGFSGEVILIGAEKWQPYERPPLSKSLLVTDAPIERTHFRKPEFYQEKRITLRLGSAVSRIDRKSQRIVFANGEDLIYDKLLLATGSKPRRLALPGFDLPGVFNLQTIDESLAIRDRLVSGARVVVVGGGYIGLEIAGSARRAGATVTVVEAAPRVLIRVAAQPISEFLAAELRSNGIELLLASKVSGIEGTTRAEAVLLDGGTRIPADLVVVGVGSDAADTLARDAGLSCRNGVVVDEYGRTEDPAIFAAGDVTHHYDPRSGTHRRLECVQNAMGQAQAAVRAMLGIEKPHTEVPTFWSDLGSVKLQIAGLGGVGDQIILRGSPNTRKFSALHLNNGKLTVVEAVNSPKDFVQGKQLIASGKSIDPTRAADPETPLSASAIEKPAPALVAP
jgi:3-phenylpropionate/trans-cinnamate dioxygenase ferredoxin reductase subunit